MKISREQLDSFEQEWLVQHLKSPDYRYGQAFLNHFREIHDQLMSNDQTEPECMRLWEERDANMARRHVLRWVK
jgi:hypothetical protein